jgi:hypothetical protein
VAKPPTLGRAHRGSHVETENLFRSPMSESVKAMETKAAVTPRIA